jgi:hypothetical protein
VARKKQSSITNREQLELFVRRAEELLDLRLARNEGLQAFFNINWAATGAQTMTISAPDEDDLRSYLLLFRQFVMNKEPIFINKIYHICFQAVTSDQVRDNLKDAREEWKRNLQGSGLRVTIDEKQMTPERVVDLMINGSYFHSSDLDLQRELAALDPQRRMLVRWVFLNYVIDASRQVLYLARVVKGCLRKGLFDFS